MQLAFAVNWIKDHSSVSYIYLNVRSVTDMAKGHLIVTRLSSPSSTQNLYVHLNYTRHRTLQD